MARDKPNKNRGVQFTHESAARIAEVVRTAGDTGRGMGGVGQGHNAQASSHYLAKTTAAWNKGSSQTLTIWAGDGGSEASSGETVEAWNYIASLPSGLWVVLARANATFYVAAFDYTGLSGHDGTKQQVLAHNASGQLVWLNTTACT